MVCASQEAREALHTLRTVNTSFLSNLDYVSGVVLCLRPMSCTTCTPHATPTSCLLETAGGGEYVGLCMSCCHAACRLVFVKGHCAFKSCCVRKRSWCIQVKRGQGNGCIGRCAP